MLVSVHVIFHLLTVLSPDETREIQEEGNGLPQIHPSSVVFAAYTRLAIFARVE